MKTGVGLCAPPAQSALQIMAGLACLAIARASVRDKGVTVCLEASSSRRFDLVRAAIQMLQVSAEVKPSLEITSSSKAEEVMFYKSFPAFRLVCNLQWHSESALELFLSPNKPRPDFLVFALDSDLRTLEEATNFCQRTVFPNENIVAFVGNVTGTWNPIVKHRIGGKLCVLTPVTDELEELEIEVRAKVCHAIYCLGKSRIQRIQDLDPHEFLHSWQELPEIVKQSNRNTAMHHLVKRVAWTTNNERSNAEMLKHLTRSEHMRWMAEKAMDNWRWKDGVGGQDATDQKKLFSNMIRFDSLPQEEKDKDLGSFLWALRLTEVELNRLNLKDEDRLRVQIGQVLEQVYCGSQSQVGK